MFWFAEPTPYVHRCAGWICTSDLRGYEPGGIATSLLRVYAHILLFGADGENRTRDLTLAKLCVPISTTPASNLSNCELTDSPLAVSGQIKKFWKT